MKSSNRLWRMTGITAVLATCLFLFGLIYAVKDILYPAPTISALPSEQQEQTADNLHTQNKIQIVGLGDSLTKGTGDETGKGYIGNVKELLAQTMNKPVYVIGNFAVNGYRTEQLLKDLQSQKGLISALQKAHVITLSIGANDIFQSAREQFDLTTLNDVTKINAVMDEPSKRLTQIFAKLAEINPQAVILYMGLYDPFLDVDEHRDTLLAIQEWNSRALKVSYRYPNIVIVPTADLFQRDVNRYLYTDHFHPNQQGYERIAERFVQALN